MLLWREHPAAMSAIGYCYFSGNKSKFRDTGFAAVFAVSVSIVKCCQKMLFIDRKMCIWSLAFHWEALSCKVMLLWREHPAAMSAVGYCDFRGDKTKFRTQALLQCLLSAFPLWSAAKKMLFVDRKMCIWSLAFRWEAQCCKVMLIWREHSAAMSAVPLGTATSEVINRSSVTQALLQRLPSAFPLWSAAKRCSL